MSTLQDSQKNIPVPRRRQAVSLEQAALDSPTFAYLAAVAKDSNDRLKAVAPILPPTLRASIKAGPIEGSTWCLIASSNAASAKLRQVLPDLISCLQGRGWEVTSIRIKVQIPDPA